jgi:hypothetical protein
LPLGLISRCADKNTASFLRNILYITHLAERRGLQKVYLQFLLNHRHCLAIPGYNTGSRLACTINISAKSAKFKVATGASLNVAYNDGQIEMLGFVRAQYRKQEPGSTRYHSHFQWWSPQTYKILQDTLDSLSLRLIPSHFLSKQILCSTNALCWKMHFSNIISVVIIALLTPTVSHHHRQIQDHMYIELVYASMLTGGMFPCEIFPTSYTDYI